jgi:hypothetical protein
VEVLLVVAVRMPVEVRIEIGMLLSEGLSIRAVMARKR